MRRSKLLIVFFTIFFAVFVMAQTAPNPGHIGTGVTVVVPASGGPVPLRPVTGSTLQIVLDYLFPKVESSSGNGFWGVAVNPNNINNTNSGNVGIGTANPGAKLDINGTDDAVPNTLLRFTKGSSRGGTYFKEFYNDSTDYGLNIGWVSDRLTINQYNGNVGIGTMSPGSLLDVKSVTPVLTLTSSELNPASASWLEFKSADAANGGRMGYIGYGSNQNNLLYITNNIGDIVFPSGNVGIGTASPGAKFEVFSPNSHIKLTGANSSGVVQVSGNTMILGNWQTPEFALNISLTDGLIGIGTNAPKSLLSLQGRGTNFGQTILDSGYISNCSSSVARDLYRFPEQSSGVVYVNSVDGASALVQYQTVVYWSNTNPGGSLTINPVENIGSGNASVFLTGQVLQIVCSSGSPNLNEIAFTVIGNRF